MQAGRAWTSPVSPASSPSSTAPASLSSPPTPAPTPSAATSPSAFCSRHGALPADVVVRSGRYASASGTSMSCPHVSGYIAVLLAEAPDLTIEQVEALITVRIRAPCVHLALATVFCADGGLWLVVRTTRSARCRSRPAPSRSARACRTPPPPTSSTAGARSASARRCPRWASPATTSRASKKERGDSKRTEPAGAGGRRESEGEALEI